MSNPDEPKGGDALANYVEVTPRALALLNLRDCREQVERSKIEALVFKFHTKPSHAFSKHFSK